MEGYKEITEAIAKITDEETLRNLNSFVVSQVRYLNNVKSRSVRYEFRVGQEVIVSGGRRLRDSEGTIEKINITKAVVNVNGIRWSVPLSMLKSKEE